MGSGGGGSQTTKTDYMPEDVQLRRMGLDYAHQGGGLGGEFYGTSPGGRVDPWVAQERNQYYSDLTNNQPMTNEAYEARMQQAVGNNPAVQGLAAPQATGYYGPGSMQGGMGGLPTAQGYNAPGAPTAAGGGFNFINPNEVGRGSQAFDPAAMEAAAFRNMQSNISPQLQQAATAGGSNPMSGAYAEAMANASAGMALPIAQQISQQQYGAYQPQFAGASQAQIQQQGAQQGLQGQGYGATLQGGLNQQQAQNAFMGQGLGGQIQGGLAQQQAANQLAAMGYGSRLQGQHEQGANMYSMAAGMPGAQAQMAANRQGMYGQRIGLAGMEQAAAQQDYLRRQGLWEQVASGLYGGGGMRPIGQTTSGGGGGGFNVGGAASGALGGAATGAMLGSVFPGIGTAAGAIGGGLVGGLGGGFCWVADALYGEGSDQAKEARAWVSEGWQGEEADSFREWYKDHGPGLARRIRWGELYEEEVKGYKALFDGFADRGREYLKHG